MNDLLKLCFAFSSTVIEGLDRICQVCQLGAVRRAYLQRALYRNETECRLPPPRPCVFLLEKGSVRFSLFTLPLGLHYTEQDLIKMASQGCPFKVVT